MALQAQIIVNGFPACLMQIDRLSHEEGIRNDPVAVASLQALAVVCQAGMNQHAEASRSFEGLVALVERQPEDFHFPWDWDRLRNYLIYRPGIRTIETAPLLRLVDAVSRTTGRRSSPG